MQRDILIVDDEQAIREMVCFALTRAGMGCREAVDANDAQADIVRSVPELILLDWMLPGLSGVDYAKRLRKDELTREIPIIMLTARGAEDDRVRGLDGGASRLRSVP